MENGADFDNLRADILACRDCHELFGFEPAPVVQGCATSRVMHISQAPSVTVHRTGRPFNDLSGKKLRGEWYRISDEQFYDPANFYITSVAHCFPGKNGRGGDRPPPLYCARKWMAQEMALVDNALYLIVGGKAAGFLFPGQPLTGLVFRDMTLGGKPAFVLPHPSPLNVKWFKDHPEFENERMPRIREQLWAALGI